MTTEDTIISFCAGYIVPPCNHLTDETALEQLKGSLIGSNAEVMRYFNPLFLKSAETSAIQISFTAVDQTNPIRDHIRTLAFSSIAEKEKAAKALALRLARATDHRSDIGLLIIASATVGDKERVVLLKFDGDESLQALFEKEGLSVKVVDGAFSRKSNYFKAAVFQDCAGETTFWSGHVEDKQANQRIYGVSDLWAIKFLQARPYLTGPRGTLILAKALKLLINNAKDPILQHALVAAATTLKSQTDRLITISEIAENYLPAETRESFLRETRKQMLDTDAIVQVDTNLLESEFKFRTLIFDNQFSITGPTDSYGDYAIISDRENPEEEVRVTLRGHLVGEKLKSRG